MLLLLLRRCRLYMYALEWVGRRRCFRTPALLRRRRRCRRRRVRAVRVVSMDVRNRNRLSRHNAASTHARITAEPVSTQSLDRCALGSWPNETLLISTGQPRPGKGRIDGAWQPGRLRRRQLTDGISSERTLRFNAVRAQ